MIIQDEVRKRWMDAEIGSEVFLGRSRRVQYIVGLGEKRKQHTVIVRSVRESLLKKKVFTHNIQTAYFLSLRIPRQIIRRGKWLLSRLSAVHRSEILALLLFICVVIFFRGQILLLDDP